MGKIEGAVGRHLPLESSISARVSGLARICRRPIQMSLESPAYIPGRKDLKLTQSRNGSIIPGQNPSDGVSYVHLLAQRRNLPC
jgi:hypothetical protein